MVQYMERIAMANQSRNELRISSIEEMSADLLSAGWTRITANSWKAPWGGFFRGPFQAWKAQFQVQSVLCPNCQKGKHGKHSCYFQDFNGGVRLCRCSCAGKSRNDRMAMETDPEPCDHKNAEDGDKVCPDCGGPDF
jgi:hypothetical protein